MTSPFAKNLAIATALNLFFMALCFYFGIARYGALDDYFMGAILSGAFGDAPDTHLFFVNTLYAKLLVPFYKVFPQVGWYYISLVAAVFVSFSTITFLLLKKLGLRMGVLVSIAFIALFCEDQYLVVQFTQAASMLGAAGMLAFIFGVMEKRSLPLGAWGFLLMALASLLRYQAFLMGVPLFIMALAFLLKENRRPWWKVLVGLSLLAVFISLANTYHKGVFEATPEYRHYTAFQNVRSTVTEGYYNQNAVYEDLEEMNLSGKDFALFKEWVLYDTEVFSLERMRPVMELVHRHGFTTDKRIIPNALLTALSNSLTRPVFWAWVLLCAFVLWKNPKQKWVPVASFFIVSGLIAYLITLSRLVYRVESGYWFYATVMMTPFLKNLPSLPKKLTIALALILMASMTFFFAKEDITIIRSPASGKRQFVSGDIDFTDYDAVYSKIENEPEHFFLMNMNSYMRLAVHRQAPYYAMPVGSLKNIVSFGYWTPYLPAVQKNLSDFGIENPMRDVINEGVYVINQGNLASYLQRHHYDSVAVDTACVIGELIFYKYRVVLPEAQ